MPSQWLQVEEISRADEIRSEREQQAEEIRTGGAAASRTPVARDQDPRQSGKRWRGTVVSAAAAGGDQGGRDQGGALVR